MILGKVRRSYPRKQNGRRAIRHDSAMLCFIERERYLFPAQIDQIDLELELEIADLDRTVFRPKDESISAFAADQPVVSAAALKPIITYATLE